MFGKTDIAVNNELGASCKYIGEEGLVRLIRRMMELDHEMGGRSGQSLRIHIVSSENTSSFSPPTAEDPILESSV